MKAERSGYIYLLLTVFLFSTYEVVSKTLVNKIDPFQINFIRFLIGGVILFCFLLYKSDIGVSLKDMGWLLLIGAINVALSMSLMQLSLYQPNAKASVAAVVFSSNPIFVTIFSSLIDKEKVTMNKIMGLVVGMTGIIVVFSDKIGAAGFKSPLLALFSAIFYGLYTVMGRRLSVRVGSLKMNAYSFIGGSLVLLPFLLIFKHPVLNFDYSGIFQVMYLSVFVTGLAYLMYFKGLSILGASKGSLVFFMKPVFASLIAVVFLGEKITLNLIFGTLLIISGIGIVIYWSAIKNWLVNLGIIKGS